MTLALPPTTEEAFLREVDEELRRDQLASVWQRWGRWIIVAVISTLGLFAAYLWWQNDLAARSGAAGEQLDKGLQNASDGKYPEANADLEALKKGDSDGYRASAMLTQAAIALEKRDLKGAAKIYGQIAADASIAQPWRDLALLRQTATEFDSLPPATVITRLKPLAIKGGAWFGSAGEMTALAYLKQGKNDLAGKIFADMAKDEKVPESIRSRAVQMAGTLGVDVVDATKEVKTQ